MTWRFDPRQLRTLESVARLGSFAAAADELGYTQSAVSQQIAELERRVGARVVDRRPVRATEAGHVLLDTEIAISASMSRAATELTALSAGTAGTIRLGAFISAGATVVPPALAKLKDTHRAVQVTLVEVDQSETYAALLRGDLDLAISFDYEHAPDPAPSGIQQTHLLDDPIMIVLPAGHPLAGYDYINPAEIAPDTWIHTVIDDGGLTTTDNRARSASRTENHLVFDGGDFRTALNLVNAGLGVALLPQILLLDTPANVVVRPIRHPRMVRRLHTCRLNSSLVPAAVRHLETYLREATLTLT